MNHASLFSGIGGFDLAAREVGWNNVFQCEIDPFCQSVLKYYFPKTVLYEDIKRTDFTSWKGKIDVLTGGFPCQPFSVAGQREGADDNRYLWPEMLRVIRETRPLWIIGENVAGITIWFNPVVKLTWKRKVIKMKKITRKRYLSKNISSIPSATILNVKDIPSNRSLFQLAVSERHTRGTGYGSLLPTVQTQGLKVCDKDGKTRFMDLSSLPKQGIKYGDLLPTPVASDHTGSCTIRKMTKSNGAPRTDSLRNMPAVIGMDGDRLNGGVFQLSPLFVEEMMGYPLMWTTLPFLTGNGEKNQ
jgi:hypothetical protein